jgi:pimeloyl-ACP methyl ester carboxylesterase
MNPISRELITVGEEIELHVAQCGEGEPVLLLHGFPELWYSWRHQMQAIADSGRRAIAPDLRGFGGSSAPEAVEAYDIEALTGDLAALLGALEIDQAVVVGHDWGSDLAWKFALLHPQLVRAVVGISVPYVPRAPAEPTSLMEEYIGEDFYIVWIQEPGVADAALSADVRRTLATREVWNAEWAARHDEPPTPPWMSEEDLQLYVDEFTRTGFTGGLNWYRNLDRSWAYLEQFDGRTIDQPALFMTGSRDPVRAFMPHEAMAGSVTDLREVVIIEGAGHWVQQERPDEVNAALLDFLGSLDAAG